MQFIDFFLLLIIAGFALFGFWFGFVHTLGSLVGTILGAFLASRYYEWIAGTIIDVTGWSHNAVRITVFILLFLVINRLVGFLFWIVDRILSLVTRLPFIRSLDRILGLLLGAAEGAVTLGLIIFFIERFPISSVVMQQLAISEIAPYLSAVAFVLWPLLPDALRLLQSSVDYVTNTVL